MKRSNGEGSITRYKDGWRGRYTDPVTHKQQAIYGKTQGEVKTKLSEVLSAIQRQEYVSPDPHKETVEQWLLRWFKDFYCVETKKSTQSTTFQGIKDHLIPALGKIQLQKCSTDDVQTAIRTMSETLAAETVRRHTKTLKQAMETAVTLKKIRANPVDNVKLPKAEKKEIRFLTDDEQTALKKVIPDTTYGRSILFLLGTGMRVSELCGLKWRDIKSDGIHVDRIHMSIQDWRDEGYINVETLPKTSNGKRVIPLNGSLERILDQEKRKQMENCLKTGRAFDRSESYIFANAIGNPADRHNIARAFRSMCNKAGIEARGVHTLRHTFATNWVRKSPDIPSLSRILGHFDTAFTYKTYCHADTSSMASGMEMMESILSV